MAPTTDVADQMRHRTRSTGNKASCLSPEDAFDAECSTLPLADREALIPTAPRDSGHQQQHDDHHHQQPHHHQHHHHHHEQHEHHTGVGADSELRQLGAKTPILPSDIGTDFAFRRRIVWPNAIGFMVLHALAAYGLLLTALSVPNWKTTLYSVSLMYGSGLGVTMGAHRLWSHRSFKARTPLKVFLLWLHTLAGQNCLYVWVRDHRQHHKYSDTDADPHNANRGFFFSHVGWLMARKHPKVIEYGRKIDMSDLEADAWIMFQKRHYKMLYLIFSLLLPTSVPCVLWGEDVWVALFTCFFTRVVIQLNATWLVNSAAHLYGTRPFDKGILPVESMFVAFFAVGEGWHNYHHAFPWDYRASELGTPLNMTGFLIDLLAKIGQVYDRKEASRTVVRSRVQRTGDRSHKVYGTDEGRSAFRTLFNLWPHPANPTYTSLYAPRPKRVDAEGTALDDQDGDSAQSNANVAAAAAVVDVPVVDTSSSVGSLLMDKLSKFIAHDVAVTSPFECNNNNHGMQAKCKSELNQINVDDVLMVKLG